MINFKLRSRFSVRTYQAEISIILLILFINFIIGCTYYKVTTLPNDPTLLDQLQKNKKYIILHQGSAAWHLKDISLNETSKELTGTIETLSTNHLYYLNTKPKGANSYNKKKSGDPTYEVHIYASEYMEGGNSQITIPYGSVKKIEVYDSDKGANSASAVFTTLGVILGVLVLLGVIVALTKSSCPFVYVSDGNLYHFAGEIYGGAIYSSLERDDYLPLPEFKSKDGTYQIKISNELLERQYTDLAELILVEHPDYATAILDKNGNAITAFHPESPTIATSNHHSDCKHLVLKKDSSSFLFDKVDSKNEGLSELVMTFKKPKNAKKGKLILNAKNSYWLDYIFGKFNEEFGSYYNQFAEKQKSVPARKNIQWSLDQGIPLSVYLETEKGWKIVDYFNVMGPLASRDLIMPLDLSETKGGEIRLKLECGFMFWEIDYAAMDFSEDIPVKLNKLKPVTCIDENGKEVSSALASSDKDYLFQAEAGNEVTMTYVLPELKECSRRSLFLHSRGYYEYIRDYKGSPNIFTLNSFKKKGAFNAFSKERYFEFMDHSELFVNALNFNNGN